MTTNAQVRTAWQTQVFANINAGANSFPYELWPETRRRRDAGVYNRKVDFWIYSVRHRINNLLMGGEEQHFEVEIVRTLENDTEATAYNLVIDDFNTTLYSLVKTNLGDTWQGTVDYWEPPIDAPKPIQTEYEERSVWEARVTYKGFIINNY